jgi:hypothetical protein
VAGAGVEAAQRAAVEATEGVMPHLAASPCAAWVAVAPVMYLSKSPRAVVTPSQKHPRVWWRDGSSNKKGLKPGNHIAWVHQELGHHHAHSHIAFKRKM